MVHNDAHSWLCMRVLGHLLHGNTLEAQHAQLVLPDFHICGLTEPPA
eukprot:CAMPEP_0197699978 /NCGR_PEP_ID=MMETSP1338-20131121/121362_1 /TAXON_ID=43686 ORGANISM="Pelagodinium beii, Strain RCC1491" /NCGR_SAMPLE_ID=MMETSP1338 /ASSEMBLY_ACC=CAM_ASM_000754 /LENGTH=46 /DNA_ID= /DNA_START= /DNA_END= /DNA_ORIENTATION=